LNFFFDSKNNMLVMLIYFLANFLDDCQLLKLLY
jgi:hypothetical protein